MSLKTMTRAPVELETQRLLINEVGVADAPFILALLNDSDFIQHIGDRSVRTPAGARNYIEERIRASYDDNGFGMYAVRLKEGGDTIGLCGLVKRDALDDIDLGYGFLPVGRGLGYALEAAKCIKRWAAGDLRMARLIAIVSPNNSASISLLEKLDMQFESRVKLPGEDDEVALYSWCKNP